MRQLAAGEHRLEGLDRGRVVAGALRRGAAFVVTRGDQLLVRTRPEKGLLGGMTEVPSTAWTHALDEADALAWRPPSMFDAVLLDAPCTATGTCRRHPDVLWIKEPKDITRLAHCIGQQVSAAAAARR